MNIHTPINPDWTEAEVETLLNMRSRGYSASQIGAAIGKTRCAVLGKAKRLKLERLTTSPGRRGFGNTPTKASPVPRTRPYSQQPRKRVAPTFRADLLRLVDIPTATIVPLEDIPSRNIPLMQLGAYHCRYITAGEGADARYCGCVTKAGKSWCAGHYSRVFRKADARELA